jgi:L-amino acid N-acyltransferase YncA
MQSFKFYARKKLFRLQTGDRQVIVGQKNYSCSGPMSYSHPTARAATLADAAAITRIYNEGIASRTATFETRLRSISDIEAWVTAGYPVAVTEWNGQVAGFAATFAYRSRPCYAGVLEFSVYVDADMRGRGVGRIALNHVMVMAQAAGAWKLLSRIFPENTSSLGLCAALGFRQVGIYEKHAQLDGIWRDVVIVEKLLP